MYNINIFAVLLAGILFVADGATASSSSEADRQLSFDKLDQIEKNLILALESNSPGLQATAARTLKQVKALAPQYSFGDCIIPLMRIVKDENREVGARIMAGLALHELRSARGDFAIKREAEFTDVGQVRHVYQWLAYTRFLENKRAATSQ